MKIILTSLVLLLFGFFITSLAANYLGSIEDAKKIELIGDRLYSNKSLYAYFIKHPEKQTEVLKSLDLGSEFQKYQNRIGLFKSEDLYISYYSGYESSIYYFPEKKCWGNLNGMYKWINLKKCNTN